MFVDDRASLHFYTVQFAFDENVLHRFHSYPMIENSFTSYNARGDNLT